VSHEEVVASMKDPHAARMAAYDRARRVTYEGEFEDDILPDSVRSGLQTADDQKASAFRKALVQRDATRAEVERHIKKYPRLAESSYWLGKVSLADDHMVSQSEERRRQLWLLRCAEEALLAAYGSRGLGLDDSWQTEYNDDYMRSGVRLMALATQDTPFATDTEIQARLADAAYQARIARMRAFFETFDSSNPNPLIMIKELKKLGQALNNGEAINQERAEAMFREMDSDQDGRVEFEEFLFFYKRLVFDLNDDEFDAAIGGFERAAAKAEREFVAINRDYFEDD